MPTHHAEMQILQMRRICPSCNNRSVPWPRLVLIHWTTCNYCNAKIGWKWLFTGALFTVVLAVFSIALLFIQVNFSYLAGVALLVAGYLVIWGTAARFGPLESKTTWWAP